MNKEQQLIIKENELFGKVRFLTIDEKEYAIGKDIAEALGYKDASSTISKKCKNGLKTMIEAPCQNGNVVKTQVTVIPEGDIYRLIIGSKLPEAEKFESWVMDEVLPELRKHGGYVTENVDEDYLKYTYARLKTTFTNCPIENLTEVYEECMVWNKKNKTRIPYAKNSKKRSDATHTISDSKIMIMQKVISTLEDRNLSLCENNKFGLIAEVDNTIKQIKDDIKIQHNKSNGAKIAGKTKKINKLQDEVNYHNPNLEDFLEIPIHAYSSNYMFESYIYNGKISTRKSDGYKKWIDNFPNDLIRDSFGDIDLNKPTKLWLKFDALAKFDRDNLVKATQDQIVRALGFNDDNNIELGLVQVNKKIDKYSEGKIYILLKNID